MLPVASLPRSLHGSGRYHFVRPGREALTRAIAAVPEGTTLYIAPGEYEEAIVIPASKPNLTLIGMGGRGAVAIAAPEDATALTNHAQDVTLVNIGCESGDVDAAAPGGFLNTGRRMRAYGCKFEGGAYAFRAGMGSVAQIDAETQGKGDDCLLEDCELAWSDVGLLLAASDYGAVTQLRLRRCTFHNLVTHADEIGAGGGVTASIQYRDLEISECVFCANEDGAMPTKFLLLNDHNDNSGIVNRCVFPTAINGGLNLVSTKLFWVGNVHTGGIAAAQPS